MPPTPGQIKELLLSAIDKDDNIVDMGSITKAITLLESNPITKEALEETRLGRLVKNVRKKATNSSLKKRCTALIKQWQSQFLPQNAVKAARAESPAPSQHDLKSQDGASTSDGQTPKPAKQTPNTVPVDKNKIENIRRRKREAENSPTISPSSRGPPSKKFESSHSPLTQDESTLNGVSAKGDNSRGRTAINDSVRTASPTTSIASPKTKPSISKDKGSLKKLKPEPAASPKVKVKDKASISASPVLTPNKQYQTRRREDNSSPGIIVKLGEKRAKTSPGSVGELLSKKSKVSYGKSPKSSNSITSCSSPAVRGGDSASTSVIAFVSDWDLAGDAPESPLPLEADLPVSSSKSLSIFDLDFNQTAQPEPQVCSDSLFDVPLSPSPYEDSTPVLSVSNDVIQEDIDVEVKSKDESCLDQHLELQGWISPPQMETLEDEPPTPPAPVLEGDIDRIHNEQWQCVNGCYNNRGEWFDWMQCLTVDTDEENSIQILPYVCID